MGAADAVVGVSAVKRTTHAQRAAAISAYQLAVDNLVREAENEAIAAMAGKPTNPARLLKYTSAVRQALK